MHVTYLRTAISAVFIILTGSAYAADWRPTRRDVADLERVLVLPKGTHELVGYVRYYTGVMMDGRRMIVGLLYFTATGDPHKLGKPGEVRIVPRNDLPVVNEDHCNVVYVLYDAGTKKIEEAWCPD